MSCGGFWDLIIFLLLHVITIECVKCMVITWNFQSLSQRHRSRFGIICHKDRWDCEIATCQHFYVSAFFGLMPTLGNAPKRQVLTWPLRHFGSMPTLRNALKRWKLTSTAFWNHAKLTIALLSVRIWPLRPALAPCQVDAKLWLYGVRPRYRRFPLRRSYDCTLASVKIYTDADHVGTDANHVGTDGDRVGTANHVGMFMAVYTYCLIIGYLFPIKGTSCCTAKGVPVNYDRQGKCILEGEKGKRKGFHHVSSH